VVFYLFFESLLLGLSLEFLLVFLLIVAFVLGLEDVGYKLETDILRICVMILYSFSVKLFDLLTQSFSYYLLIMKLFICFSFFLLFLSPHLPLPSFINKLMLKIFLPQSSLSLELLIIVINPLILMVHFSVLRFEIIFLHSLMFLLHFLIS